MADDWPTPNVGNCIAQFGVMLGTEENHHKWLFLTPNLIQLNKIENNGIQQNAI